MEQYMETLEVIDAHAHLVRSIEEEAGYYLVPGRRDLNRYASPQRVIQFMDSLGISKMAFMILIPRQYRGPLALKAKLNELPEDQRHEARKQISQKIAPLMRTMNEWGCETGKRFPRLHPFICISDDIGDANEMVDEVVLRSRQGARGVKLHPGIFSFFPHDERYWPVYQTCQELGLPIVADSGPCPPSPTLAAFPMPVIEKDHEPPVDYGEPKHFSKVLEAFPRLNLVLAHLGSAWWDERIELAQKYPNVFFDTSQGFSAVDMLPVTPRRSLAEEDAARVLRKIGMERIMFGTDFPAVPAQPQLEQILRLPITDEEKRLLLSENAKWILHL
jgi:predicted TIM-barrel fold metal-dependent hydrolase